VRYLVSRRQRGAFSSSANGCPGWRLGCRWRCRYLLDFGGLAVGDRAGDVMAAFHLFADKSRLMFRTAVGADDATWARARGWALTQGLEALPYYLDTHPGMVAMARRVIGATLS
jgi:aminoglycoside phosphotransferase (APT) family kinase protein